MKYFQLTPKMSDINKNQHYYFADYSYNATEIPITP